MKKIVSLLLSCAVSLTLLSSAVLAEATYTVDESEDKSKSCVVGMLYLIDTNTQQDYVLVASTGSAWISVDYLNPCPDEVTAEMTNMESSLKGLIPEFTGGQEATVSDPDISLTAEVWDQRRYQWVDDQETGSRYMHVTGEYGKETTYTVIIYASYASHEHSLTKTDGYDPTCTQPGQQDYWVCSTCNNWYSDEAGTQLISDHDSVVIPALDHQPGDPVKTVLEEPTVDSVGHMQEEIYCTRNGCGQLISRNVTEIPKITYSADKDVYTWNTDSTSTVEIVFHRSFKDEETYNLFEGIVKTDDTELGEDDFTAASGSLKITLPVAYLKTLAVGEHKITVSFSDGGSATATLKVTEDRKSAQTSEPVNYGIWGVSLAVVLAGAFVTLKMAVRKEEQ